MKKFLKFLPALLLMMVVTATFAFRSAPKATHKATVDSFILVPDGNGGWEQVETAPTCLGSNHLCAIFVEGDETDIEQAELEITAVTDFSSPGTLPSGASYSVKD